MMALVGCLAYEFQVTLPVVAKQTFHGGAHELRLHDRGDGRRRGRRRAVRRRPGPDRAARAGEVRRCASAVRARRGRGRAERCPLELVALALVGAASVAFLAKGNSTLQLAAAPQMRGRVMALWAVAFLGSTPIGGPIAGWVSESFGGRAGLALGALACVAAALLGELTLRRLARRRAASEQSCGTEVALSRQGIRG